MRIYYCLYLPSNSSILHRRKRLYALLPHPPSNPHLISTYNPTDYSQCLPCTGSCAASPTTTSTSTSSTPTPPSGGSGGSGSGTGGLQFAGVNIAGFDFGCNTDGSCTASAAWPPLTQYYGASFFSMCSRLSSRCLILSVIGGLCGIGMDGAGQMKHFVSVGYNVFRLPVGWQFLVNDVLGADIDQDNLAEYDALVQVGFFPFFLGVGHVLIHYDCSGIDVFVYGS